MSIKLELNLYLDIPSVPVRALTGFRIFDRRSMDVAFQAALVGAFGNVSMRALRVEGRVIIDSAESEPYVELIDVNLVVRVKHRRPANRLWTINPVLKQLVV